PIGKINIKFSKENAWKWYNYIKHIAEEKNILDEFNKSKFSNVRGRTTEECIKLYEDLKGQGIMPW
ncbi:MAG: hypothetical protein ACOCZ5_03780, partial [bacterium]